MPHKHRPKATILFVHGGMTFKSRRGYLTYLKTIPIKLEKKVRWHTDYLDKKLGKHVQIIRPMMPSPDNARYDDRKLFFERYIPFLQGKIILIGNSLGGIFLAKYLSENKFPKKILSVYLVCPPFRDTPAEDLAGGFKLRANLSGLEKSTKHLSLLFSEDDDVVPVSHAELYRKKLPHATIEIFSDKNGHFKVPHFPELVKMIQKDLEKK